MERQDCFVECSDGFRLSVQVVTPLRPRAAAVVGHAMMVDRRTMDQRGDGVVSALARRGIAAIWPDLRGHGGSGPLAAAGGSWSYGDLVELDTPALLRFARQRFPGLPVAAVGHSLFGHVALAHVARHPEADVDGLVLLAANVWAPRWEPDPRLRLEKRLAMEALAAIVRAWGYFPSRRLGVGSCDEAAPMIRRLVDNVREDDWRSEDGFSYAAALPSVRRPLLSIAAAGDRRLCSPGCAARFVAAVRGAELLVVGLRSGLVTDGGHMALVTDPRCRPAWDRVADFILRLGRPRLA